METQSLPSKCPSCGGGTVVTDVVCEVCGTAVSGNFSPCACASLEPRLKTFHDAFLQSRGNIRDVERVLGISYPTVRGLLDELLDTLFPADSPKKPDAFEVLSRIERGEITAKEAARILKDA